MQHTYQSLIAELTREQRLELLRRSDRIGLLHLVGHWGAIVVVAMLITWQIPGWQALLFVQGVLIISTFTLLHETIHKTAFKSGWINVVVSNASGLLVGIAPIWFRHFHTDHHRYTNDSQRDPELATPRPANLFQYVAYLSGIPVWWSQIRTLIINAIFTNEDPYVRDKERHAVQREARLFILIYIILVVGSLYLAIPVLAWVWLMLVVVGQPFLRAYLLAEHGGCPQVEDMLINSRTTFTNRIVRFLAWNMPYHAEHHTFPAIPFHNLPKFHEYTRDHLGVTETGYGRFHGNFIHALNSGDQISDGTI